MCYVSVVTPLLLPGQRMLLYNTSRSTPPILPTPEVCSLWACGGVDKCRHPLSQCKSFRCCCHSCYTDSSVITCGVGKEGHQELPSHVANFKTDSFLQLSALCNPLTGGSHTFSVVGCWLLVRVSSLYDAVCCIIIVCNTCFVVDGSLSRSSCGTPRRSQAKWRAGRPQWPLRCCFAWL
jgi:hypothetical protein